MYLIAVCTQIPSEDHALVETENLSGCYIVSRSMLSHAAVTQALSWTLNITTIPSNSVIVLQLYGKPKILHPYRSNTIMCQSSGEILRCEVDRMNNGAIFLSNHHHKSAVFNFSYSNKEFHPSEFPVNYEGKVAYSTVLPSGICSNIVTSLTWRPLF